MFAQCRARWQHVVVGLKAGGQFTHSLLRDPDIVVVDLVLVLVDPALFASGLCLLILLLARDSRETGASS